MREPERARSAFAEKPCLHSSFQFVEDIAEQAEVDVRADHRSLAEHRAHVVGQRGDPVPDNVAHSVRQVAFGIQRAGEFLDEERVSARSPVNHRGGLGTHQFGHRLDRKPAQIQPDRVGARESAQRRGQFRGDFGGPIRRDQQHRSRGHRRQQRQGFLARPLHIVQHEQQRTPASHLRDPRGHRLMPLEARHRWIAVRRARRDRFAERGEDPRPGPGGRHPGTVRIHAPRRGPAQPRGEFLDQRRLARACLAGHQHEPESLAVSHFRGDLSEPGQLRISPGEPPGYGRRQLRSLRQDVLLHLPQRRTRVNSKLRRQPGPRPAQSGKRVTLTSSAVQRERQQSPRLLAQRMSVHKGLQIRHGFGSPAEIQQTSCPTLQREQPQFVQSRPFGTRPRLVGELRVRLAPPPTERLVQLRDRRCTAQQCLEPPRVDLLRFSTQRIPRSSGDQQLRGRPRRTVRFERTP